MKTYMSPNRVDRAGWPEGPWDDEPDKISWTDELTGYPCLIVRNHLGGLCGYVAVNSDHPLYGLDYDSVDVDVHGGLTYADKCQETSSEAEGICHVPEPGQPEDVWWFGFDCVHGGDVAPYMLKFDLPRYASETETYKDVAYVAGEVWRLAKQLRDLGEAKEIEVGQEEEPEGCTGGPSAQ